MGILDEEAQVPEEPAPAAELPPSPEGAALPSEGETPPGEESEVAALAEENLKTQDGAAAASEPQFRMLAEPEVSEKSGTTDPTAPEPETIQKNGGKAASKTQITGANSHRKAIRDNFIAIRVNVIRYQLANDPEIRILDTVGNERLPLGVTARELETFAAETTDFRDRVRELKAAIDKAKVAETSAAAAPPEIIRRANERYDTLKTRFEEFNHGLPPEGAELNANDVELVVEMIREAKLEVTTTTPLLLKLYQEKMTAAEAALQRLQDQVAAQAAAQQLQQPSSEEQLSMTGDGSKSGGPEPPPNAPQPLNGGGAGGGRIHVPRPGGGTPLTYENGKAAIDAAAPRLLRDTPAQLEEMLLRETCPFDCLEALQDELDTLTEVAALYRRQRKVREPQGQGWQSFNAIRAQRPAGRATFIAELQQLEAEKAEQGRRPSLPQPAFAPEKVRGLIAARDDALGQVERLRQQLAAAQAQFNQGGGQAADGQSLDQAALDAVVAEATTDLREANDALKTERDRLRAERDEARKKQSEATKKRQEAIKEAEDRLRETLESSHKAALAAANQRADNVAERLAGLQAILDSARQPAGQPPTLADAAELETLRARIAELEQELKDEEEELGRLKEGANANINDANGLIRGLRAERDRLIAERDQANTLRAAAEAYGVRTTKECQAAINHQDELKQERDDWKEKAQEAQGLLSTARSESTGLNGQLTELRLQLEQHRQEDLDMRFRRPGRTTILRIAAGILLAVGVLWLFGIWPFGRERSQVADAPPASITSENDTAIAAANNTSPVEAPAPAGAELNPKTGLIRNSVEDEQELARLARERRNRINTERAAPSSN